MTRRAKWLWICVAVAAVAGVSLVVVPHLLTVQVVGTYHNQMMKDDKGNWSIEQGIVSGHDVYLLDVSDGTDCDSSMRQPPKGAAGASALELESVIGRPNPAS